MPPRIRWLAFFALLAFAVAIFLQPNAPQIVSSPLTFIVQPTATAATTVPPTIFSEAITGRPRDINPLLSDYNDADQDLVALIFSGLTTNDFSGQVKPALARSWDVSDDGLIYTFVLRNDVTWHDGMPFNSRDVLATITLLQANAFPAPPALTDFWRRVAVSTPGEYTVTFTLSEPYAPFLSYTSLGLLPAHIIEKIPPTQWPDKNFNANPIGTGPFRIKLMDQGNSTITLEPFNNYYGPKPKFNRVDLHFYPSDQASLAAYRRGDVLAVGRIPPALLPDARKLNNLTLYAEPMSGFNALYLNLNNPLFQQKEVRQALLLGLDRQRVIDNALDGQGLVADSPLLPQNWAFNRFAKKYAPDITAAKALLGKAGWSDTNGDGVLDKGGQKFQFAIMASDQPGDVRVIEEITRQWSALGVVTLPQVTGFSGLARDFLRPRKFDSIFLRWLDPSTDPDQYALWHSTRVSDEGQNYAGWQSRDADEVLEQGRRDPDIQNRIDLYTRFQDLFADQVPTLLLSYPIYVYGVDKRVQNVQVGALSRASDRFRTMATWSLDPASIQTNTTGVVPSPTSMGAAPISATALPRFGTAVPSAVTTPTFLAPITPTPLSK